VEYPVSKKVATIDTYFDTKVKDPYRWLEDDRSTETEAWIGAQNKTTFEYLAQIPYRNTLKNRLSELWNYQKVTAPFTEGAYTYFYKNDGLQNHYVLYRFKNKGDLPEVFLDPNTFSKDGTTSLAALSFSKNGALAAYSISEGGSDWRKVMVINTRTKELKQDTLVDVKFSGLSWKENEGFYYSSYDKPKGSEHSAKTDQHKLYYHKLGTPQQEDQLIFGGIPEKKRRYVQANTTEDHRYLIISAANATSGNELYLMDLQEDTPALVTILDTLESDTVVVNNSGTTLYLSTNREAPSKKIITVDATDPTPKNWKDLIPETEHVLSPSTAGNYIFAKYMVDAIDQVKQYDYSGKLVRDVSLPGIGSVLGFSDKKEATTVYYTFSNYITSGDSYVFDMVTGTSNLYKKSAIAFDSKGYQSEQVFYTSKDGTKIPMVISYKKGLKRDGKNPTMLYGYGGFNVSLPPFFSIAMTVWMEQGGVYAVPNLRGGGEYGKKWHGGVGYVTLSYLHFGSRMGL